MDQAYLGNFVICAMGGMLAAAMRTPLLSILLVLEMTNSFHSIYSVGTVAIVAYLTAELCKEAPIYDSLLEMMAGPAEKTDAVQTFFETKIPVVSGITGKELRTLNMPEGTIIVSIARRGMHLVPLGDTKLEAGEVPVHARTYDLWKTITDVVLSDEQRIEDGKIDIEGLDGPPMLIYADPDFVHQVVYNIVDNAIKFTPEGGSIRFSAQKKGDMVEVRIENTGAGIAPEALPFVFERFYKEDRSRGVNTRGSGLGLHICKILINLSGGKIHAESEPGKWCRFVFTLPAGK